MIPDILISVSELGNVDVKELIQIIFATKSTDTISCMKMKSVQKVSESAMLPTSEVSDTAVPCIRIHLCLSRGQSYNTQTGGRLVLVPPSLPGTLQK